jgi:hypothetical protein
MMPYWRKLLHHRRQLNRAESITGLSHWRKLLHHSGELKYRERISGWSHPRKLTTEGWITRKAATWCDIKGSFSFMDWFSNNRLFW